MFIENHISANTQLQTVFRDRNVFGSVKKKNQPGPEVNSFLSNKQSLIINNYCQLFLIKRHLYSVIVFGSY